jgi:hypothetical protein
MRVVLGRYPGRRAKKPRRIEVRIDDWDVWGLDNTLALIIHPALVRLREKKHGSGYVADEDVPEEMRLREEPSNENAWEGIPNVHERWDWVLDEMIWAFEHLANEDWEEEFHSGEVDWDFVDEVVNGQTVCRMVTGPNDTFKVNREGLDAANERIRNGTRLFGKYFQALWD